MIAELSVENLAIIEQTSLHLGPGFTALTGETGAGKSLLIDAIELVLGDRADSELVRSGAETARVAIRFDQSEPLSIVREVSLHGRSSCKVNGQNVSVGSLRALGKSLVDLHGQHDHQSLLDPVRHLHFLDNWIGAPAHELLAQVEELHRQWSDAKRRLTAVRTSRREREQRVDMLRFQIADIETVGPIADEMEALETRLDRLRHTERIRDTVVAAIQDLSGEDNAVADTVGQAVKRLDEVVRYDTNLEESLTPLREAAILLQEGAHLLSGYLDQLEADPEELETVAGRIDALRKLRRKYGESEEEVLAFLERAREELDLLDSDMNSEESLAEIVATSKKNLDARVSELSSLRHRRADDFASLVQAQLRELAMERAIFQIEFGTKEPEPDGQDLVEFYFSANAGESPKPLAKIASGGELSRVMLGIKTALAGRAGVPTLIFDEVDAGLGGRAAATVARKLRELSKHYQVIVISHLPQIASQADVHFHIDKEEQGGRVKTSVRRLQGEERVSELARMLAGDAITESALANAREMLTR
jgi:DNA repair protein RecN (Recombination protein N)